LIRTDCWLSPLDRWSSNGIEKSLKVWQTLPRYIFDSVKPDVRNHGQGEK
jgi:hypothetical protein